METQLRGSIEEALARSPVKTGDSVTYHRHTCFSDAIVDHEGIVMYVYYNGYALIDTQDGYERVAPWKHLSVRKEG